MSQACCSIPPVKSDYTPIGTIEQIGDLPVYVVGPADAKKTVVVMYDIFGLHNNTKQFADKLAESCNFKVVMPDFFRGESYPVELLGNLQGLLAWIEKIGSLEIATNDLKNTVQWLRANGAVTGGIVGFCWGGKRAAQYSALDDSHFFAGISMVHPSFVDLEDAKATQTPVLALPSINEPDMSEYMEILSKKPFGKLCRHHRFDDMHHGFAGARGDYTNELNAKRATEAIQLTANFFNECMNEQHPNL